MREIKFRAWNTRRKEMEEILDLYWFEENSVHENGDMNYIILQFTGLKDRRGVEIYEGDVARVLVYPSEENRLQESIYRTGDIQYHCAGFCLTFHDLLMGESQCYEVNNFYDLENEPLSAFGIEVIGNLYANPDLIKGGE